MSISLQVFAADQLPSHLLEKTLALLQTVWPGDANNPADRQAFLARNPQRPHRRIVLALEAGEVLAHAEVFSREIRCDGEPLRVGCLAGVCVLPDRRGESLGQRVVEQALESSHGEGFPVVLFQTGVADFYRGLGAALVENRFVDSLAADPEANPWWDSQVMIHPGDYPWPRGVVDLQGGAY